MGIRVMTVAMLFALFLAHPAPGQPPGDSPTKEEKQKGAQAGDPKMVPWVLGALTAVVITGGVLFTVVIMKAIAAGLLTTLRPNERVMRLNFVIVILLAAVYLQLASALADGVLALLGTIAGYVLGGITRAGPRPEQPTNDHDGGGGPAGGKTEPTVASTNTVGQPDAVQPKGSTSDANAVGPAGGTGT